MSSMTKIVPRLDQLKSSTERTVGKQVIDRTFDIRIWAEVSRPNSEMGLRRIIKNELDK